MMRINLDQIEEKIKVFFENNLLFLADTNVHENISKELCNIIINASKEIENERLIAPNTFDIFLSPFLYKKIDNTKEFTTSLSKKLQELIHDSDISTLSPITISIFQLDEFSDNEFDIQYTFSGHDITNTSSYLINQPSKANETTNPQIQSYIIYGDQIININISVFNIGRGDGNDLILNDRFISRAHAQIRYIDSKYILFDLNSTAGTYLNGERIKQQNLKSGDVITLAKTDLVFGIENEDHLSDTSKYSPL